ncbi:hypothetical protein Q6348_05045 [Isoptericola sp. b441]|uniref:C2H2-type domain-containing protein n=1 Tax=Actinotalea lenta TaxID=3064654 RepID=A0ABT9D6T8_9CELL|nr:hypothetical protein [Isoptericola sp. b441]MDO8106560.1 hypothetical protein [Isoptericola sp. b441]
MTEDLHEPAPVAGGPDDGTSSEPVSAVLRDAKSRARATHYTVGTLRADADGTLWLECSCGTVLRNGPTWTLDEHVRLHRAEAKYLELSQAAPPGIPRLIDLDGAGR